MARHMDRMPGYGDAATFGFNGPDDDATGFDLWFDEVNTWPALFGVAELPEGVEDLLDRVWNGPPTDAKAMLSRELEKAFNHYTQEDD